MSEYKVTADTYTDNTIIEISTENGDRMIHFFGFGYYCDKGDDKSYRFVEYTGFIVPLKDVLKIGIYEYESENQEQFKQYITDCTDDECRYIYEHYDNGNKPKGINVCDININTPDGSYILFQ